MADKTTNINIKYNVDFSTVQKAEAASVKAQAATENLRRSADQFAKQFQSGNIKSTDTIAGLTLKMQQLKAQIELTYLTDTKRLTQLSGQYKAIQSQVDAYNKSLLTQSKAAKDAGTASQGFASQLGGIYSAIKLVLGAGLVKEFVDITLSMSKLKGNVEGVERAFQRTFPNSVHLLGELREATHGTVTDFELMQRTLQATNLGINVDKLGILFEFAAARAQQTGESVDYLVDSIVRGIGRKSILVLDNLGLSATRLKEQFKGASLASQSVADVTTGVAEIAKVELEKMGGYVETSATQVYQLERRWAELKIEIAKKQDTSALNQFWDFLLGNVTAGVKGTAQLTDEQNKLTAANKVAAIIEDEKYQKLKGNSVAQIDLLFQELISTKNILTVREREIEAIEKRRQALIDDPLVFNLRAAIEPLDKQLKSMKNSRDVLAETLSILKKYVVELRKAGETEDAEGLGIIGAKRKQIKDLQDDLEKTNKSSDLGESGKLVLAIKKAQNELDILLGKAQKTGNEIREFLGYLSDLDMYQDKQLLTDRKERAKKLEGIEKENNKRSADLQEYFRNLRIQKRNEEEQERIKIIEDNAVREMELRRMIANEALNITADQVNSILSADVNEYDARIQALRDFYDEQINLAGDNEKAKKEIRIKGDREVRQLEKERADREKKAALAGILVNTALGIAKAFATAVTIYDGIVQAAIVTAEGASQYAIASSARYYAKGEVNIKGPGTETSDSIPAMLSRGESVMTAKQTRESFGILTDIRAGKLNDRVIRQLVNNGGSQAMLDDSRIVKAIESQPKPPSLVKQGRQIYEVYEDKQRNKRYIRSKNI